ncbi:MAG: hypothetical protein AAF501_07615 [Pseudomonadota bacterium]
MDDTLLEQIARKIAGDSDLLEQFIANPDQVAAGASGLALDTAAVQAVIDRVRGITNASAPQALPDAALDGATGGAMMARLKTLRPIGPVAKFSSPYMTTIDTFTTRG